MDVSLPGYKPRIRFQSVPRPAKLLGRRSVSPYSRRLDLLAASKTNISSRHRTPLTNRLRLSRVSPISTERKPSGVSMPCEHFKANNRYAHECDFDEVNVVSTPSTIHEEDQKQSTDFDFSLLQYYQGELDHASAVNSVVAVNEGVARRNGEPERSETPRTEVKGNKAKGGSLARRVSKLPPIVRVYHFTKKEIGRESPRRVL